MDESLPNDPVFFNYRIGQYFLCQAVHLFARAVLQPDVEDFALPNGRNISKSKRCEAALDCHSLRIENRRLQRHNDRSFHAVSTISGRKNVGGMKVNNSILSEHPLKD